MIKYGEVFEGLYLFTKYLTFIIEGKPVPLNEKLVFSGFVERRIKNKSFCFPFNAQNVTSFQGESFFKISSCKPLPFTDKVISKVSITHEKLKATLSCFNLINILVIL